MLETAEADNLDKYKSYIQRRRVSSDSVRESDSTQPLIKQTESLTSYSFGSNEESKVESDRKSSLEQLLYEDALSSPYSTAKSSENARIPEPARNHYSGSASTARKADPSLYRRLYSQNHRNARTSSYTGSYRGYGSTNHAEIEDNRATVLAVKIIKQALACFAVLGIIILLQQRSDTVPVLAFIKKQVVDTHIEPKSLLTGVENIWKDCSRFLGGSP